MMTQEPQISDFKIASPVGTIALRQYGEATREVPVLCLHGWLDNLESFTPLARAIQQSAHPLNMVGMDFPGHGHSDWRPQGVAYHFIDGVTDAMAVIEHFGWPKCHLIGHSMGAAIGALLAASFPERVCSLVSIEALGPLVSLPKTGPERLAEHVTERLRAGRSPRLFASPDEAIRLRADRAGPAYDIVAPLVRRNLKKVDGGWQWRTDPRLRWRTPVRMTESQVQVFLRRIRCPVAVFKAESGFARTGTDIDRRWRCLHHGQLFSVPGGHHCHMEYPEIVGQAIADWWQAHFPKDV
ncbi:MAG: alpha/beta hydrolase [Gammaproteobacteria bacterium]|nr:MAG: alpha/beta hydrolase [Gammaproteobacteria bacterium]